MTELEQKKHETKLLNGIQVVMHGHGFHSRSQRVYSLHRLLAYYNYSLGLISVSLVQDCSKADYNSVAYDI